MSPDALHIFFPPAVGVVLTVTSFALDGIIAGKLQSYLLERRQGVDHNLVEWTRRLAKAIALLVTYYGNVIVLLSNLFLAFAVFPSDYTVLLICVGFVVLMLTILQVGWLQQYEAIEVETNVLQRVPVVRINLFLRCSQIVFNLFTIGYFGVGYCLSLRSHGSAQICLCRLISN